jgi:hypothetical protein
VDKLKFYKLVEPKNPVEWKNPMKFWWNEGKKQPHLFERPDVPVSHASNARHVIIIIAILFHFQLSF